MSLWAGLLVVFVVILVNSVDLLNSFKINKNGLLGLVDLLVVS